MAGRSPSVSRRSLVRVGVALSALAAASGGVDGFVRAGAAPGLLVRRAQAARSGVFRWSHENEWAGKEVLDPASPNRFYETLPPMYNRLVKPDNSGNPVADLAETWEPNADATAWTFTLRDGVAFHDGKPFTSADVVYTINHVLDPALESPSASVLEIVDTAKFAAPDPRTVVFSLKQPHADFPRLLMHYSCYIIPEGSAETEGTRGIGTGPFKLESFKPGATTTLVANDAYWGGKPSLAKIELIPIADADARIAALMAGQVDYADALSDAAMRLVQTNSNLVLQELPGGDWVTLVMRCDTAPFDDPNVRRAMKLVLDRDAVVQAVTQGHGTVATDHPVWPGDPYVLRGERARDIGTAKTLLADAGHAGGLTVDLHTSDIQSSMSNLAVVFKEQAAEAGVAVNIRQSPADGYWNDVWMKAPFCTSSWGERPADQVLNEVFRSGASWNESFWSSDEFGAALDAARRELDPGKRTVLYQQAQQLLMDGSGNIIPFFLNSSRAMSNRVRNFPADQRDWDFLTLAVE